MEKITFSAQTPRLSSRLTRIAAATLLSLPFLSPHTARAQEPSATAESPPPAEIKLVDDMVLRNINQVLPLIEEGKIVRSELEYGKGYPSMYHFTTKEKINIYMPDPGKSEEMDKLEKALHEKGIRTIKVLPPVSHWERLHEFLVDNFTSMVLMAFFGSIIATRMVYNRRQRNRQFQPIISKKRFTDLYGVPDAVRVGKELVHFLKAGGNNAVEAVAHKAALIYGPKGTGKMVFVHAVAGESEIPIIQLNGSQLIHNFNLSETGMARAAAGSPESPLAAVREAQVASFVSGRGHWLVDAIHRANKIAQKDKSGRCIVLIDELDAISPGKDRGSETLAFTHREALDQLRDCITKSLPQFPNVFLLATSTIQPNANMKRLFGDRIIQMRKPQSDVERQQILDGFLKKRQDKGQIGPDADTKTLAKMTHGYDGARIQKLIEKAARIASLRRSPVITMADFDEAITTDRNGELLLHPLPDEDYAKIGAHLIGGHAVIAKACQYVLDSLSLAPRTRSHGHFRLQPKTSDITRFPNKPELMTKLMITLAGIAGERTWLDSNSNMGNRDLKKAKIIIRKMIASQMFPGVAETSSKFVNTVIQDVIKKCVEIIKKLDKDEMLNIIRQCDKNMTYPTKDANDILTNEKLDVDWKALQNLASEFVKTYTGR